VLAGACGTLLLQGTGSWLGAHAAAFAGAAGPAHAASAASTGSDSTRSTPAAPRTAALERTTFRRLETRLTLREPFNLAANKVRVVAFLSPSCPRCLMNAAQLQREVLEQNDTGDLTVFIVWLKVLAEDDEDAVRAAIKRIPDPRVQHFWDPERLLNHWLLDAIQFDINLRIYDVMLLYDREARWEKVLPRPGYWMHEVKGAPGPKWDVATFAAEIDNGLRGEPFTEPYQ
jgi:hypothetical protein